VTNEVVESGGGDKEGGGVIGDGDADGDADGEVDGVAGLTVIVGVVVVVGPVVCDGLMIAEGNVCVVITVGTGRDLSRRCASARCARILLMLSECEGTPSAGAGCGRVLEGAGRTLVAGVLVGEGVTCGVPLTLDGVGCGVAARGVGCGVGLTRGCC
jgi:hypothetical protein